MEELINFLLTEQRYYWRIENKAGKVFGKYMGTDESESVEKLMQVYPQLMAGRYMFIVQPDANSSKGAINREFITMAKLETPNFSGNTGGGMELGIQIGKLLANIESVNNKLDRIEPLIPTLEKLKSLDLEKLIPVLTKMQEVDKQLIESLQALTDDDDDNDDDAVTQIMKASERVNQVKELFDSYKKS